MIGLARRSVFGRVVLLAAAGSSLAAAGAGAWARDDAGVHDFLVHQGADAPSGASVEVGRGAGPAVPEVRVDHARTLTVRMHPRRAPAVQVAQARSPGKVSIYEDTTLRPGDAVMTAKGIRVFAGSRSWPYREDDFVALADAGRIDSHLQKQLADLDRLPQG